MSLIIIYYSVPLAFYCYFTTESVIIRQITVPCEFIAFHVNFSINILRVIAMDNESKESKQVTSANVDGESPAPSCGILEAASLVDDSVSVTSGGSASGSDSSEGPPGLVEPGLDTVYTLPAPETLSTVIGVMSDNGRPKVHRGLADEKYIKCAVHNQVRKTPLSTSNSRRAAVRNLTRLSRLFVYRRCFPCRKTSERTLRLLWPNLLTGWIRLAPNPQIALPVVPARHTVVSASV